MHVIIPQTSLLHQRFHLHAAQQTCSFTDLLAPHNITATPCTADMASTHAAVSTTRPLPTPKTTAIDSTNCEPANQCWPCCCWKPLGKQGTAQDPTCSSTNSAFVPWIPSNTQDMLLHQTRRVAQHCQARHAYDSRIHSSYIHSSATQTAEPICDKVSLSGADCRCRLQGSRPARLHMWCSTALHLLRLQAKKRHACES